MLHPMAHKLMKNANIMTSMFVALSGAHPVTNQEHLQLKAD
jgi:hypothetical protein